MSKEELIEEINKLQSEYDRLKTESQLEIRSQQQLEIIYSQSQEKYKLLAENIIDVIWVLDISTQRLIYVSPSVINLTGFTSDEAMSQSIVDALVPESANMVFSEIPVRLAQFLSGDSSNNTMVYEWQQYCKDGSIIWVEITTSFVYNEDKSGVNIIGVSRNIECRKKNEKLLEEKTLQLIELNSTKDKFFSIIAHDLRNPLGSFKQMLDVIINNFSELSDDEKIKFITMMKDSSNNLYKLLDNLLTWSRIQRGTICFEPMKYDISAIIKDCVRILNTNALLKKINLTSEFNNELIAQIDVNMISTVILNMVSNAIKFTNENGNIQVIGIDNYDDTITVLVKDDGIGISPSKLENLFRIDVNNSTEGTSNEKGTGLGLILCKEFVEKHNGTIRVESNINSGTTFYFTLPKLADY